MVYHNFCGCNCWRFSCWRRGRLGNAWPGISFFISSRGIFINRKALETLVICETKGWINVLILFSEATVWEIKHICIFYFGIWRQKIIHIFFFWVNLGTSNGFSICVSSLLMALTLGSHIWFMCCSLFRVLKYFSTTTRVLLLYLGSRFVLHLSGYN